MKQRAARDWLQLTPAQATSLADRHGTPAYLFDLALFRRRVRRARAALPGALLFAVKANPHPALLEALRGEVEGLDLASEGELAAALAAGWPAAALSFAGPGKAPRALSLAVQEGVVLNLESPEELRAVASLARAAGRRASVRLRLNPKTPLRAWRVAMVGGPSPFGIDEEALPGVLALLARERDALALRGLHVHPGGQCTSVGGFAAAVAVALDLTEQVSRALGGPLAQLNLGGGLGALAPGDELDVEAAG